MAVDFKTEVQSSVSRLQECLDQVFAAMGGPGLSGAEVARALGLDNKLAWKLTRLARETDALKAVPFVPGEAAMQKALDAMSSSGLSAELVTRTTDAFTRFVDVAIHHAGNRTALDLLVAADRPGTLRATEMEQRRNSFVGNAYTWGVQAEVQLRCEFIHPSAEPGFLDFANIRGFYGLQRNRSDVQWPINRARFFLDSNEVAWKIPRYPIDPQLDAEPDTIPLLRDFCSQPIPEVRRTVEPNGNSVDHITAGAVGKTGAMTILTGEHLRRVRPDHEQEPDDYSAHACAVHTPSRLLHFDTFVYDGCYGNRSPKLAVFSELTATVAYPLSSPDHMLLPLSEKVEHLGQGLRRARSSALPNYLDLIRHVLDRLGWDESRFDVYRLTIEYPPIPVAVEMRWDISEPKAES
ncbi:MAG: hypothetical protein IH621_06955 [Krumholzibacteria bacterium]|nr:hypothetical protein [Candidatus Krumholzibacteria bacterium]